MEYPLFSESPDRYFKASTPEAYFSFLIDEIIATEAIAEINDAEYIESKWEDYLEKLEEDKRQTLSNRPKRRLVIHGVCFD